MDDELVRWLEEHDPESAQAGKTDAFVVLYHAMEMADLFITQAHDDGRYAP